MYDVYFNKPALSTVVEERLNIIMEINPYLSMNVQQRITVGKR